ncbi:MAG: serine/threonine-protein kinase [Nocardioides sp.]
MGEVFAGRFELVEPIAEGGMGSVWVVRDRKDGELYAGKLLRQSDSASLLRFMREQATRIRHDHVVTPLSWAGEDDRVLFTMPLVRGGSVATLIGDFGRLPPEWVVALLDQLLQALEAVHAAGVVHRDVKPGNLLLDATGTAEPRLRLSDFGISARVDEPRLTRTSQVIGSPGYMAPEQLAGADPDVSQDLYAVGMVGLEMITGVRPPAAVAEARDRRDAEPAVAPLVDLLLETAAPLSRDRPTSAGELRARLRALDLGRPGSSAEAVEVFDHVSGAAPTPTRPDARHGDPTPTGERVAAFVLVVVALACVVGAIWILVS